MRQDRSRREAGRWTHGSVRIGCFSPTPAALFFRREAHVSGLPSGGKGLPSEFAELPPWPFVAVAAGLRGRNLLYGGAVAVPSRRDVTGRLQPLGAVSAGLGS